MEEITVLPISSHFFLRRHYPDQVLHFRECKGIISAHLVSTPIWNGLKIRIIYKIGFLFRLLY